MMHKKESLYHPPNGHTVSGFTLIELMIVVAIVAVLLSLALPVYSNYARRAKIAENLSVGNSAKTSVSATCVEDLTISALNNSLAGYSFEAGSNNTDYVESVQASGPCTSPLITITSKNTGQSPAPDHSAEWRNYQGGWANQVDLLQRQHTRLAFAKHMS